MQKLYVGKSYRHKRQKGFSQTIRHVVDVTFGGDVLIREYKYCDRVVPQEEWLSWVKDAKEV